MQADVILKEGGRIGGGARPPLVRPCIFLLFCKVEIHEQLIRKRKRHPELER